MSTPTTPTTDIGVADAPATPSIAPGIDPGAMLALIERVAANPQADVQKLERLVQLYERARQHAAELTFNAAMRDAQAEMGRVRADADNPSTKSRYASYAALDRALRPIYTAHGFSLSFDTDPAAAAPDHIVVQCYVCHVGGFTRTYRLDLPADGKGARGGDVMTRTHAMASGASYGMRYLLKMIFNVAVGEDDDDGNRAGRVVPAPVLAEPEGFTDWWDDLLATADEGYAALEQAWKASSPNYRRYAAATRREAVEALKARARERSGHDAPA